MSGTKDLYYENFEYPATDLNKFFPTAGIFTISLKGSDKIVNYIPDDPEDFQDWLIAHGVQNMRKAD